MVASECWNIPTAAVPGSCGIRCVLYRHHLLSTSLPAWLLPLLLDPQGLSCPFSIPAFLGCAPKLIVKEEVTTGCGHHTKKRCHLPENWDWSFLLCSSSFPYPWRLLSALGLGLKASLFPTPSRDLCPLTLEALLRRKDSHTLMASRAHTSPEG